MLFNPKTGECKEFFQSKILHTYIDLVNYKYILKEIEIFSHGNIITYENGISTLINLDNDLYFEIQTNNSTKIIDLSDGNIIIYDDNDFKIFNSEQKRITSSTSHPKEHTNIIFMHPNGNLMYISMDKLKVIELSSIISTSIQSKYRKIDSHILILPNGNVVLNKYNETHVIYTHNIQNNTLNKCDLSKNSRIKIKGCLLNNQIVLEKYNMKSHKFTIKLFNSSDSSSTVLMKYTTNTELEVTEIKIINNRKILYGLKNGTILVME